MNRPEHMARFEEAFRSEDPVRGLYQLAVALRDEGVSQVTLYRLFSHFQVATPEDHPGHDAIMDTMDLIYGGPWAKGHDLYPDVLSESAIKETEKE